VIKVKEENQQKFMHALQNVVYAIKSESEECGKLCGGISEKELHVINFVGGSKNVKMSDIAENIDSPMSTLTNIVDKLVDKKYLSREHSEGDRRVINVTLGENGKTAYKVLSSKKKFVAEKVLSGFSEAEQNAFIDHMNVLASALAGKK
jgi:DNA-binding MarR family transcriptional regulator